MQIASLHLETVEAHQNTSREPDEIWMFRERSMEMGQHSKRDLAHRRLTGLGYNHNEQGADEHGTARY